MAPSTKMIGQVFRDELAKKITTLPVFLRPQIAPVLGLLFDWVELVEGRLSALEKMPSAEAISGLLAGPITEEAAAKEHRRAAHTAQYGCGDCND